MISTTAIVCIPAYLLYMLCSMVLSCKMFDSMKDTFIVSIMLVVLNMFMNTFLGAVLFLVAISLGAWFDILLPPAMHSNHIHTKLMSVSIVGLTVSAMKIMLELDTTVKKCALAGLRHESHTHWTG